MAVADVAGVSRGRHHKATTTAMVVESDMTPADMVLAFETSLGDGGWPTAWARDVTAENLELAGRLAAGTVIERRLEAFFVRAETLSD